MMLGIFILGCPASEWPSHITRISSSGGRPTPASFYKNPKNQKELFLNLGRGHCTGDGPQQAWAQIAETWIQPGLASAQGLWGSDHFRQVILQPLGLPLKNASPFSHPIIHSLSPNRNALNTYFKSPTSRQECILTMGVGGRVAPGGQQGKERLQEPQSRGEGNRGQHQRCWWGWGLEGLLALWAQGSPCLWQSCSWDNPVSPVSHPLPP